MPKITLPSGELMLFDKKDKSLIENHRWHKSTKGYAKRKSKSLKKWVYFHKEVLECPVGMVRDHINRNRLDNRRSNLRIVTLKQNAQNRSPSQMSCSKYKGVRIESGKYFRAKIQCEWIGYYKTEKEAAKAYDKEAKRRYGEYAYLNFPDA